MARLLKKNNSRHPSRACPSVDSRRGSWYDKGVPGPQRYDEEEVREILRRAIEQDKDDSGNLIDAETDDLDEWVAREEAAAEEALAAQEQEGSSPRRRR